MQDQPLFAEVRFLYPTALTDRVSRYYMGKKKFAKLGHWLFRFSLADSALPNQHLASLEKSSPCENCSVPSSGKIVMFDLGEDSNEKIFLSPAHIFSGALGFFGK